MAHPELHLDRARAESFGAIAEAYDRHRPDFPATLLDDVAALGGRALDIGCGTGKVARGLARRGVAVVGIDVDPEMARVARSHGVAVEVARFETWDDAGRRFDVVTCGDAWHWLEPAAAVARVAHVLRPGGSLVRFFNLQVLDDTVMDALDRVYRELAPEVLAYGRMPDLDGVELFAGDGPFAPAEPRTYTWERHVTAEQWTAFANTISDHQRLPDRRRRALLSALRSTIERLGEPLRVRGTTFASFARRTT